MYYINPCNDRYYSWRDTREKKDL